MTILGINASPRSSHSQTLKLVKAVLFILPPRKKKLLSNGSGFFNRLIVKITITF